jgi:BirA family biotin operon repressor/biotin-[acetyl-CoA-carboxylase] ligase
VSEQPGATWEGWTARELAERWGSPEIHLFESLGSSNDVARRLASVGAPPGTVVLAEEQVAGRGRAGRIWASPPGLGLWFSVVGRAAGAGDAGPLPLRVGLAVAAALDPFLGGAEVGIKWPNDLWVGERKLGGILCEASWTGERPGAVVAGVGLNVLHPANAFPEELRNRATSLALETARPIFRGKVADAVIPLVLRAVLDDLPLDVAALASRDLLRGHRVVVSDPMTGGVLAKGTAAGILADGSLRVLRAEDGEEQHVRSGTVRRLE